MSDIVERLREVAERADANYPVIMQQAADTITALRAENERLRAALELFACDCAEDDLCKFPHACRNYVARAALEEKP